MNKLVKLCSAFLIFALGLSFAFVETGYACSCMPNQGAMDELEHSEAVFTGTVTSMEERGSIFGGESKAVHFQVKEIWKGVSSSEQTVLTGWDSASCGFGFEAGKEYLVYADSSSLYGDAEELTTSLCSRTAETNHAAEDLAVLGKGEPPIEGDKLHSAWYGSENAWIPWAAAAIVMTIAVFWRRLKSKKA